MLKPKEKECKLNVCKIGIVAAIVFVLIVLISLIWYSISILPVEKNNDDQIEIVIPLGTGSSEIANILKENEIIRNEMAFKIYVKLGGISNFQAGKYYLKQSMGLKEITDMLKTGKMHDPNQISLTYIEGKNIRWLAKTIEEKTNNKEDDVYELLEDGKYVTSLIDKYWFLTDEIRNQKIYYALEGYLFPDTYALDSEDVKVQDIFEKMLDRMGEILSKYEQEIEGSEYTVHELLTAASIVETESMNEQGRKDVASVIYNRLDKEMPIQSDVTTYYAIKVEPHERDLYQREIDEANPYNTRRT